MNETDEGADDTNTGEYSRKMSEKLSFKWSINQYAFSEKGFRHDSCSPAVNLLMSHGVDAFLAVQGLRVLLPEMLQVTRGHCFGLDAVQVDDIAIACCGLNLF